MADWPTIPDITDDFATPLRAMKNILDMITRQRPDSVAPMARIFRQPLDPSKDAKVTSRGNVLKNGDLWIDTANNNKLRFWDETARSWGVTS